MGTLAWLVETIGRWLFGGAGSERSILELRNAIAQEPDGAVAVSLHDGGGHGLKSTTHIVVFRKSGAVVLRREAVSGQEESDPRVVRRVGPEDSQHYLAELVRLGIWILSDTKQQDIDGGVQIVSILDGQRSHSFRVYQGATLPVRGKPSPSTLCNYLRTTVMLQGICKGEPDTA